MTIQRMEAYCVEIHDQILVGEDIYKIYDISDEAPDNIIFFVADEENIHHKIRVHELAKLLVLVDVSSEA